MLITPRAVAKSAAIAAFFLCTSGTGAETQESLDALFGDFQGCALVLTRNRHNERFLEYGPEQCQLPQSPCSTFKIPNALIALQTGVAAGPEHPLEWDGEERLRKVWNQDHTLRSAIEVSAVWYFQALARDIGPERMQAWLDRLDYGNRDISGGIDQFWLSSSLEIDAWGQLELLKGLATRTLPFRPDVQNTVINLLEQPSTLDGQLYGKTGSCLGNPETGTPDHGWFVGWVSHGTQKNPAWTWFVINIRGDDAWGTQARAIALELLQKQL